ncbi:c-type cytochrome [Aerolutibacter ruishenii]|uniref:Cytochrome c553 n=1 Tax=Aerolutibacter ruishenii TaxID=686800 RepID=A0A562LVR6_9GAMM|nr:c-type cytochrome [Lysobacter ruishenii]TWI11608.1 cytochrome c553 [Lysobacter ruishenii]
MTTHRFVQGALAIALLASVAAVGCAKKEEAHAPVEGAHAAEAPKSSSAGLPDGHIAAGEELAKAKGATGQSCVDCHGTEGNAPIDPSYPKLAGQYADYLAHALTQYRSGDREHALMSVQAKSLTDQQIADLGAYFGSRKGELRDLQGLQ